MGRINRRRDRWLKRLTEKALGLFFHPEKVDLERILAARPRRILIVRQHNQMGDMLCAVPALRAIRETFPFAKTLLITAPVNDGVVRGNPYLDEILLFDKAILRRSPAEAWLFLRELRRFGPELAIVLNTVSFSATSAYLAVMSGARFIIGGDSRPFGWSFSDHLFHLVMPTERETAEHAIDHGLAPLEAVGISTTDRSTLIGIDTESHWKAAEFLESIGSPPYAVLHPGAGKEQNRWPASRFAAMAGFLVERGCTVFASEGPADAEAVAEMQTHLPEPLPVLRNVNLQTVAAAYERCRLALVNDTGVMHLAGAVGVPTLALFGPTPASVWQPPSPVLHAIQSGDGRMESIGLEEVRDRLQAMLDGKDPRGS